MTFSTLTFFRPPEFASIAGLPGKSRMRRPVLDVDLGPSLLFLFRLWREVCETARKLTRG